MSKATLTVNFELDGYTVSLALAGDSGAALLRSWSQVKAELKKLGAEPVATTNGSGSNGGQPEAKICPVHHAPMQRRTGKGGDVWYSHKAVDPDTGTEYWCRGNGGK